MEENYKAKYEKLMFTIKAVEAAAGQNMEDFPEPKWPDAIDDRKKVIWFRNDVFDHGHAVGMMSACRQILKAAEET